MMTIPGFQLNRTRKSRKGRYLHTMIHQCFFESVEEGVLWFPHPVETDDTPHTVHSNLSDKPESVEEGAVEEDSSMYMDVDTRLLQSPIEEEIPANDAPQSDPIVPADKPEIEEVGARDVVVKTEEGDIHLEEEEELEEDGGSAGGDSPSHGEAPAAARTFKMGIHYFDLLFLIDGEWSVCRMCKTRGPAGSKFCKDAKWAELVAHCQFDHPKAWEELSKLSMVQIAYITQTLKQRD